MKIELQLTSFEEKHLLKRMLELYLYDLSKFEATDLDEHGEFGYRYLDHYWTDSHRYPFFVKIDGKLGGFVLVNQIGYTDGIDHSVAEFFVMKKYRKNGIGRAAALAVFEKFNGFWEIRTHQKNEAAKSFWRNVIENHTNGKFEELEKGLGDWSGPIWTFENKHNSRSRTIRDDCAVTHATTSTLAKNNETKAIQP